MNSHTIRHIMLYVSYCAYCKILKIVNNSEQNNYTIISICIYFIGIGIQFCKPVEMSC